MANSLITAGGNEPPVSQEPTKMAEQQKDTRVVMYNEDGAREFASPDEVPKGEGWVDHPDKVKAKPVPAKPKGKFKPASDDDDIDI